MSNMFRREVVFLLATSGLAGCSGDSNDDEPAGRVEYYPLEKVSSDDNVVTIDQINHELIRQAADEGCESPESGGVIIPQSKVEGVTDAYNSLPFNKVGESEFPGVYIDCGNKHISLILALFEEPSEN